MSRIGRQPIPIPQGVKVQIEDGLIRAEGPKGKLSQPVPSGMAAKLENDVLTITRDSDHRTARAMHGLTRALIANMVTADTRTR